VKPIYEENEQKKEPSFESSLKIISFDFIVNVFIPAQEDLSKRTKQRKKSQPFRADSLVSP